MTDSVSGLGTVLLVNYGSEPLADWVNALETSGFAVSQLGGESLTLANILSSRTELVIIYTYGFAAQGLDLCRQLQQQAASRLLPVIVISPVDHLPDRLQAFDVGVADCIRADLWIEEIVARMRVQVMTYRRQLRLQVQAQRAVLAGSSSRLLTDLQGALRRQAQLLQAQNQKLQQEMQEREQAQQALRIEQQKSEQLLLNILPKAIVDKLKQLEGSLAERFDDVTILFADIVNFTPLAAQVGPLDLVNWLNQIFSAFDRLAEQYHLEKIKTIGDAYMVVGGLPVPTHDHAEAMMEMAIAMQETADRMARTDGQTFQLRIGINTGAVVAGVIGIKKFSYDLWGDAVNIASRMESQGMPGKIQVTEATYQRVKHRYQFCPSAPVMVKGHGDLATYQYVGR
ncbi:adenylate/guanylate cyclase domain-containing protein [Nodosilinea sp. P-1105]|uniref:adenylate/guanylate cyclase domain-containing protein n=1 Tax=Nodosilinea sp. P-1105 TaxID=2546229 RepID=UPI00146CBC57|nr:adenylate/guanylate cyclase domain-containing protein [Nodosilinea sp. P-1105]NMF86668.1 adenylate/guanylate cyclase domain-containing response regulator [Nodosilinea sp. P-1105]